jgi:arsenic resistance protein ArsH
MVTIPNRSSLGKAYQEFDENGRMKRPPCYERLVDVMEERYKFTLLVHDPSDYLSSRYSERREAMPELATTLAAAAVSHEVSRDETKGELASTTC